MTVTPAQAFRKYGTPEKEKFMKLWDVPEDINHLLPTTPNKIYCNVDLIAPLEKALRNLISRGFSNELKTWDGCFNIRRMQGVNAQSLHSWGIAVDVNAAWNQLGKPTNLSAGFVKCFTDAGFEWGGTWARKDGMHFQLAQI